MVMLGADITPVMVLPLVVIIFSFILLAFNHGPGVRVVYTIVYAAIFFMLWFNTDIWPLRHVDEHSLIPLIFFAICVLISILSPFLKMNHFAGIRIAEAFINDDFWKKIHSISSVVIAGFAVPQFLLVFYLSGNLNMVLSIVLAFVGIFACVAASKLLVAADVREYRQAQARELVE